MDNKGVRSLIINEFISLEYVVSVLMLHSNPMGKMAFEFPTGKNRSPQPSDMKGKFHSYALLCVNTLND